MGRKIFVSYKYSDSNVYTLHDHEYLEALDPTTVRDYVTTLQELLDGEHINKGENDNESLAVFKNSTIESKLRDKIFDSSITIVMISPNMKEPYTSEADQWIPWEIAYSLKEHSRDGRTSRSNAILAVVLPNQYNLYDYFWQSRSCCSSGCRNFKTDTLFQILQDNMFNIKKKEYMDCLQGDIIHYGECSYIPVVQWHIFSNNINTFIDQAFRINDKIHDYEVVKTIK